MAYEHHDMMASRLNMRSVSRGELTRVLSVLGGSTLCLAAVGLWVMPNAISDPAITMLRSGLSFLLVGVGFTVFTFGREVSAEEIQLDVRKGRLRQISRDLNTGQERSLADIDLQSLQSLDLQGQELVAVDYHGQEVLRALVGDGLSQDQLDRLMRMVSE